MSAKMQLQHNLPTCTGVILAAGRGSRLKSQGRPKPLVSFMGMSLLERSIRTLKAVGMRRIVVVTGYAHKEVEQCAERLGRKLNLSVSCVYNDQWQIGNGSSVLAARRHVSGPFVLVMCDHIFSADLLERLLDASVPDGGVLLGVDGNLLNPIVDRDDVTKVARRNNQIIEIGKSLTRYDGYDTGAFLCTHGLFNALEKAISEGEGTLSQGIMMLVSDKKVLAVDVTGCFWADIDDAKAIMRAEKAFMQQFRGKLHDGPVSRWLNRPISTRLSRWLVWTPLSPNHISIISFLMALVAAYFLSKASYFSFALGGLLAQMASVVDGCDGEVARIKWQKSEYGAWLDAVLDRYADAFLLTGITWHVANYRLPEGYAWLLGLMAIVGSLINSYTADKYDGWVKKRQQKHRFRLGRDVRMFLVFLSGVLYRPVELLVVLAGLMNVENIRRIWVCRTG